MQSRSTTRVSLSMYRHKKRLMLICLTLVFFLPIKTFSVEFQIQIIFSTKFIKERDACSDCNWVRALINLFDALYFMCKGNFSLRYMDTSTSFENEKYIVREFPE